MLDVTARDCDRPGPASFARPNGIPTNPTNKATCIIGALLAFWATSSTGADAFTLLKGKGAEVCEAYVKRLNQTDFSRQYSPHCGRLEDTSVPGFDKLTGVQLSYDELFTVGDLLLGFYSNSDQDYLEKLNASKLDVCKQPGREKYCEHLLADKREEESQGARWGSQLNTNYIRDGIEIAWRYDPPIDIDNDSKPDPVLLFRSRCSGVERGGRTLAYVMTDDSYRRVDEGRTRAIFGHLNPKWPSGMSGHEAFRYIGIRNGVFSYRGQFYFDTFFPTTGDFNDGRVGDGAALNVLGVFQHRDARTRQVCEIRWNDSTNASKE